MHVRLATAGLTVGAALVAIGGACSSFESTPDETGGSDATTATETSPPDGTPPPDGSGSFDAGLDAQRLCPQDGAVLCDDFERDQADLFVGWSAIETSGGSLTIVTEDAGPGRSLEVFLPPSTDAGREAYLRRSFTTLQDQARVAFSFRVIQDPSSDILVAQFDMGNQQRAFVMLRNGKLYITEMNDAPDGGDNNELSTETLLGPIWHRVTFTYAKAPSPKITLTVDKDTVQLPVLWALDPIKGVEIGSTFAQEGKEAILRFDDVLIETTF